MKAALLLLALAGQALAEPAAAPAGGAVLIDDGARRWRLELPAGFAAVDPPPGALASFRGPGGRALAAGKLRVATDDVDRPAWSAGLEDGVRAASPGYRRLSARTRKLGKLAAFDLWYACDAGVRGSRFVMLRGYAVVLTASTPRGRRVEPAMRRAVESFGP